MERVRGGGRPVPRRCADDSVRSAGPTEARRPGTPRCDDEAPDEPRRLPLLPSQHRGAGIGRPAPKPSRGASLPRATSTRGVRLDRAGRAVPWRPDPAWRIGMPQSGVLTLPHNLPVSACRRLLPPSPRRSPCTTRRSSHLVGFYEPVRDIARHLPRRPRRAGLRRCHASHSPQRRRTPLGAHGPGGPHPRRPDRRRLDQPCVACRGHGRATRRSARGHFERFRDHLIVRVGAPARRPAPRRFAARPNRGTLAGRRGMIEAHLPPAYVQASSAMRSVSVHSAHVGQPVTVHHR